MHLGGAKFGGYAKMPSIDWSGCSKIDSLPTEQRKTVTIQESMATVLEENSSVVLEETKQPGQQDNKSPVSPPSKNHTSKHKKGGFA